ncbi:traf3-interacting protein 1 [Holotrichia oblita]|uniref:Traf3-interacting protein 1 n=1 Tax=Holotrichia oblita TaxID=644536 RepID=A0ACB9TNR8_HOLOL|nr:traf3-interacting protein 1 [Holotrichia oblita]
MSEDVKLEVIEKTQKVLGKHISKPVLSEKLLRKPPFRFLHDVVTAVIKDTGFLKGMYTESELISDNVKERDLKIAFLTKLIDAIKILTEIELKVKPTKIIAGLEPSETNKLLQAIGYALDKKIDSTEYIKKIDENVEISKGTEQLLNTEQEHHLKHNTETSTDVVLEDKDGNLKASIRQEIQKPRMDRPKSARPQSVLARPMSSLRPPSVRPSSARPGAPRLRPDSSLPLSEIVPLGKINVIVENYNGKEVDEEETVVIHNAELEAEPIQKLLDIPEDKGHLVEQILEQIHDEDVADHVKNKNEIDWESKGFHNKDTINREISQVRSQIQSLTKVANPLGKLMNYLHEDVESMLSELNMWVNMKREVHKEIAKQKKNNEDSSKPLMLHLQELDDSIRKQEAEIISIRSNILRNDLRIKDLLIK